MPSTAPDLVSARDRARLLTNAPRYANRFVWVGGRRHAILHLSLVDLECFRAAVERMAALVAEGAEVGFSLALLAQPELVRDVLKRDAVEAAAIALRLSPDEVRELGAHPLELVAVAVAQIAHNLEVDRIREIFPLPPDDEAEVDVPDDPSDANPFAVVEKLASGYHWTLDECLRKTLPQVYLLANASAWTWHRSEIRSESKADSGDAPSRSAASRIPKQAGGKTFKRLKDMNAAEYREYLATVAQVTG